MAYGEGIVYQDGSFQSENIRDPPFHYKRKGASSVIIDTLTKNDGSLKKSIWKEYEYFSYEEIRRYSILQSLLSSYNFLVPIENLAKKESFATELKYIKTCFQGVDYFNFNVLPLRLDGIYPASDIKFKKEIVVTSPQYIPGKCVVEQLDEVDELSVLFCRLTHILESELSFVFKDHGITGISLSPINIKYIKQENGYCYLILTDIAVNMSDFIRDTQNTTLVNNLEMVHGEKLQNFLDDNLKKDITVKTDYSTAKFRENFVVRKPSLILH